MVPAVKDLVQTMFSEKCAQQLRNILLLSTTVSQWIADVSEDLEEQLIEEWGKKLFSVQIDKATDYSGTGHLIAYVRYVEDRTVNEDMDFWWWWQRW
jgi:hypothetical protein